MEFPSKGHTRTLSKNKGTVQSQIKTGQGNEYGSSKIIKCSDEKEKKVNRVPLGVDVQETAISFIKQI